MKGMISRPGELSLEEAGEDDKFSREHDSKEIENLGKIGRIVVFLFRCICGETSSLSVCEDSGVLSVLLDTKLIGNCAF